MNGEVFRCSRVEKIYTDGETQIVALTDLDLGGHAGEMIAVVGPSGSGKSTLLHLVGGLDSPDAGSVRAAGYDLQELSATERTEFRAGTVSFVFSDNNLLPILTAHENVMLGLSLLPLSEPEKHARATAALAQVGLSDRAHANPGSLSSGERQCAAVARAIARRSPLVIADEPTAHLDHEAAAAITSLLSALSREVPCCVLLATHDETVASASDRVVRLLDGRRV